MGRRSDGVLGDGPAASADDLGCRAEGQGRRAVVFRDFNVVDLYQLDIQPRYRDLLDQIKASSYLLWAMTQHDWARTAVYKGRVVACIGATDGILWAYLAADMKGSMLAVTREGLRMARKHGTSMAQIDKNHANAVRWASLAGLKPASNGYWKLP